MKFRLKILIIFFLSILLSVVVFLGVVWYLVSNGWWAGINTGMMNEAADGAALELEKQDTFDGDAALAVLNTWKEKVPGMDFELFRTNGAAVTTTRERRVGSLGELLKGLSQNDQSGQNRRLASREITFRNGDKAYLAAVVPMENFSALIYSINPTKGLGIFGKMCLIGVGITVAISFAFAFLFSGQLTKRFDRLYREINAFDLQKLDIEITDDSRDEVGRLANLFNKMSERLKRQVSEKNAYHEERKQLVSNLSHDLRTPLTSIIGYSESLENGIFEDEEERRKHLGIIRRKALYMERLLGGLLELSRLESGNYELKKQTVDAAELAREILIEYIPALQGRGMELDADIPDAPLEAALDRDGISRVLRNLMDNAMKYSQDGRKIGVSLADGGDTMRIGIRDTGKGIDEKNLNLVFKRYYRAENAPGSEGTGLGLAIADEIVRLHGGKITVESREGEGSTFTVVLPK